MVSGCLTTPGFQAGQISRVPTLRALMPKSRSPHVPKNDVPSDLSFPRSLLPSSWLCCSGVVSGIGPGVAANGGERAGANVPGQRGFSPASAEECHKQRIIQHSTTYYTTHLKETCFVFLF